MKRIQRILSLAPTPFFADRGCHMHIAEQAYALQRRGLEVRIVTYPIGRDLAGLTIHRTTPSPWYRKLGPGPSWHKFYVDPLLLVTALRSAEEFQPDIIHAHLHEGCILGSVIRWRKNIPLVFDVQGSLTGELLAHRFPLARPSLLRKRWYTLERWIDHLPDVIIAQSAEMQRELVQRFHVNPARIHMAYDGVNTHVFRPGDRDQALAHTLGIPPGKKVLVYLGGLSPHKGVDILLDAFPLVLREVPQAFLLLMGYPNEDEYRARVHRMGLHDHVRITGRVPYEDAPRYLTLGDIAIAPKRSQTEANGKVYNYMACGLPTVAFDTVVNRDILGDLGVYVHDLNDVAGLAQAISSLLRDDARRQTLAEHVRARAVEAYSWDRVAERLLHAFASAQEIFASRRVPRTVERPEGAPLS